MKKTISIITALTTVLWLSGVAMIFPVQAATFADGDLARESSEFDVYIIKLVNDKQFKRLILNPDVFNMYGHLSWDDIQVVDDGTLDDYTTSTLVRADGDDKVYNLYPDGDVGTKKWVESLDCFTSQGFDWDSVYVINTFDRDSYTTADTTLCGDDEVVEGDITLSLASDTPEAGNLPYNAQSEDFLKINVEGSGTITQMVFKRTGVGDSGDFDNVYLYENGTRLTSGRSVSSATDKVTFIGLSVEAPTTLTVKADLAGNSNDNGHSNGFKLASAVDVTTDATVGGSFPISGDQLAITSVQGGKLNIDKSGSIANPNVGESQAEITEFQMDASYESINVESLTLYNAGSMNSSEITNISIKVSGEEVATADTFVSDLATFTFDTSYLIDKGETKTFRVYGDLAGEPDETIKLYVEVSADVRGTGVSYGHGVEVDITDFDSTDSGDCHSLTLQGGEITITFNNPTTRDVADDTNDTIMLDFNMAAASDVEVRRMRFYIGNKGGSATMANLITEIEDVKLKDVDSGLVLMGPTDGDSFDSTAETASEFDSSTYDGGEGYVEWTDAFDIDAGESKHLQLTMDIKASSHITGGTDEFAAMLYSLSSTTSPIKYRNTNTYVANADMVPNTNQEGNRVKVQSTSISVALGSIPTGNVDVVKGQKGVTAQSLVFTAGVASDMELTDLTLKAYVSDRGTGYDTDDQYGPGVDDDSGSELYAKNVISNVYLYESDGTTKIAGPKGFSGTNSRDVVFDGLSWDISADSDKEMLIVVDVSSEATSGSFDFVYFDIDDGAAGNSNSDVTAVDDEGNSTSPSSTNLITEDAPDLAVRKQDNGTLTAAAATSGIKPKSTYVYQGQAEAVFSKFKFTSTIEAFVIDKLTIEEATSAARASNIGKLYVEYENSSGVPETKEAVFGSTASASFSNMDFYIPEDDYAYVTIKGDLSTYDEIGNESGNAITLNFEGDSTTAFHAVGQGSNESIEADDSNISDATANSMTIYRAFPSFTLDNSDGATKSSMSAVDYVLEFTVTNNGDYDLEFSDSTSGELTFDVLGSGDGTSNAQFKLYTTDGTEVASSASTTFGDGSQSATFDFTTSAVTISKGGSESFYVEIDSGQSVWDEKGDWLQFKLREESNVVEWTDGATDTAAYSSGIKEIGIPMSGPTWTISW